MKPQPSTSSFRTPDFASLQQAPERGLLHVLATASRCARTGVILEHRDLFEAPDNDRLGDSPTALDLAARDLVTHIDELLASLRLYEIALRDDLRPELDDMLF